MTRIDAGDSLHGFYHAFFETRRGQIVGLATPTNNNMRDGLAVTLIARLFPSRDYPGISVQPGRPALHLAKNAVLIGSSILHVDPNAHAVSGPVPPLGIGEDKLGDRVRTLQEVCCYEFTVRGKRKVINKVTGAVFIPKVQDGVVVEDYGIIRRQCQPFQSTVTVEGLHRLGTLGGAMVGSDKPYLDVVWEVLEKIEDFDESLPLEILVQCRFQPQTKDDVYGPDNIDINLLNVVYNRNWIYDFSDDRQWKDQQPWDVHLSVRRDEPPRCISSTGNDAPVPRLELRADLSSLDRGLQRLCRETLKNHGATDKPRKPGSAKVQELLQRLTAEVDLFTMELVEERPFFSKGRSLSLPQGKSPIRRTRKQFLLHLALCRLFGKSFRCDLKSIQALFPDFKSGKTTKPLEEQFVGYVAGRMREGFEPLLGPTRRPKEHLTPWYSKRSKSYELRLGHAEIVIKLRLNV